MANTTRGRQKTSIQDKKRNNKNYRPDRNGYGPVKFSNNPPVKPAFKGDRVASKFWDLVVPELHSKGVACEIDTAQLQALCEFYSLWRREATTGGTVLNIRRAYEMFDGVAGQFGLSPKSRTKITEHDEPQKADGLDNFFQARSALNDHN